VQWRWASESADGDRMKLNRRSVSVKGARCIERINRHLNPSLHPHAAYFRRPLTVMGSQPFDFSYDMIRRAKLRVHPFSPYRMRRLCALTDSWGRFGAPRCLRLPTIGKVPSTYSKVSTNLHHFKILKAVFMLRSLPFCDVTQSRLAVTDVSGQPISLVFKGQADKGYSWSACIFVFSMFITEIYRSIILSFVL